MKALFGRAPVEGGGGEFVGDAHDLVGIGAVVAEKANFSRALAAKTRANANPITERLERLANDLDATADAIEERRERL